MVPLLTGQHSKAGKGPAVVSQMGQTGLLQVQQRNGPTEHLRMEHPGKETPRLQTCHVLQNRIE